MSESNHASFGRHFGLALSGLAVGWLTGMAVSPTIGAVIAGILGTVTAAAGVLGGLQIVSRPEGAAERERFAFSSVPVAILCLSIALGAAVGLYSRNHGFLAPNPDAEARRYGLPRADVARRLFDLRHPPVASASVSAVTYGLYAASAEECEEWKRRMPDHASLLNGLRTASDANLAAVAAAIPPPAAVPLAKLACPELSGVQP